MDGSFFKDEGSVSSGGGSRVSSIQDDSTQMSFKAGDAETDDNAEYVRQLARKETRAVHFWLVVVTIVLLGAAVVVIVLTFLSLEDEDDDDFRGAVSVTTCA